MRYVKYADDTDFGVLQVGVQISCRQGALFIQTQPEEKVVSEIFKKTVQQLLVMETNFNDGKGKIHWEILDVMDPEGNSLKLAADSAPASIDNVP